MELPHTKNAVQLMKDLFGLPYVASKINLGEQVVSFPGGIFYEIPLSDLELGSETKLLPLVKLETIICIHYLESVVRIALLPPNGIMDAHILFNELKESHKPDETTVQDILNLISNFITRNLGEKSSGSTSRSTTPTSFESAGVSTSRLNDDYSEKNLIGAGSYGLIYKVKNELDGFMYAVKVIKNVTEDNNKEDVLREVQILALAKHNNVLQYHCAWMDLNSDLCICMELCSSNLQNWLNDNTLEDHEVHAILKQLGEAVCHLHGKRIVHCDLCLENVMMDFNNVPKIGDFGLAVILEEGESTFPWRNEGHILYKAPEMEETREPLTPKIDIFALGFIFLQVICNHLDTNWVKILHQIQQGEIPKLIKSGTKKYNELLISMINVNPANRISGQEVLTWLDHLKV